MQSIRIGFFKTARLKIILLCIGLLIGVFMAIKNAYALPRGFKSTVVVDEGLHAPTSLAFAPDGRIFIAEQNGEVRIVKNGILLSAPFVAIPITFEVERGLLGIAFDPKFDKNHYIYFFYTTSSSSKGNPSTPHNRVSRFTANGDMALTGSEVIILDNIPSPSDEHNAGCLRFGLDRKLYISTGDGGHDYGQNAQDLNSLNGKILRTNPNGTVPNDNPFIGQANVRAEIWAYGLRNPYRFTIHPLTGIPIIADVGDETWEEVDIGEAGANYCWPFAEGPEPEGISCAYPIYAYKHGNDTIGAAIIGGVVYNGNNFPSEYIGNYFFGDFMLGYIWRMILNELNQVVSVTVFNKRAFGVVDFAEGTDGALYYITQRHGRFSSQLVKIYYEP